MVDWEQVLDLDRLDLPERDRVDRIKVIERTSMDGDPLVEVWVGLARSIQFEDLSWELVKPIERVLAETIMDQEVGFPIIRFFTADDYDSMEQHKPEDDVDSEQEAYWWSIFGSNGLGTHDPA